MGNNFKYETLTLHSTSSNTKFEIDVWRYNHPEATTYSAMAKRFATDVGCNVCNEALQIFGGYGYIQEYPLERYVRDVRVHQILEGTNEIMRMIIGRRMMMEDATNLVQ